MFCIKSSFFLETEVFLLNSAIFASPFGKDLVDCMYCYILRLFKLKPSILFE